MSEWLTTVEFAALVGIGRQVAHRALRRRRWRKNSLEVRKVNGRRGGNAGEQYQVNSTSLPLEYQHRLKVSQTLVENHSKSITGRTAEHTWWLDYLRPALQHPVKSTARTDALAELADNPTRNWEGTAVSYSLRTLQRHAARFDEDMKVGRHGRSDRGKKRVVVSRRWDKLVPFDASTKAKIAEDLKQEIRGLLKGGMSWGHTLQEAEKFLIDATRAWGFRPGDPNEMERACSIPTDLVSAELHFRNVHRFKRDHKAYDDRRPRIRRTVACMQPMELVVGDVHPVDIHLTRPDGTVATARLIGFLDWATQRLWIGLIFFEKRGGVQNRDVIEVFAAMIEAWGMPQSLYVDNGKEFGFAAFLDDAMLLTVPGFHGPSRSTHVINALPYNASAKPIERLFGDLETRYFSTARGHIGGNRMSKKQEAIGRTVAPFGAFEDVVPAIEGFVRTYNHTAQGKKSALKGLSPEATFRKHLGAGWAPTAMSRDEVRAACARTEERSVVQGAISVGGRHWTCLELQAYQYEKIWVRVPAYHTPAELLLLDRYGERVGIASPDVEFHPLDKRGAKASAERAKVHRQAVRDLDRSAPDIDVAARLIARGQAQPDTVPNEPVGIVSYDPAKRPARIVMPKKPLLSEERRREQDERIAAQMDLVKRIVG
ncbi:hypothetical protein A9K65_032695 (plasmid) [Mesorhizobium sp. WSM1497]|uniref:hypothetical protein n=1 Tax=Mesorhizobium sp. WSM1497 TaxID=278153 RepID=UPI000A295921|nr:hypothetical protein [Mesorhizobium sp. WSM1497]ARP68183.1 hypothetical protein A9K65_032695 [Mesorhizobium sp. WSM1497]